MSNYLLNLIGFLLTIYRIIIHFLTVATNTDSPRMPRGRDGAHVTPVFLPQAVPVAVIGMTFLNFSKTMMTVTVLV